MNRHLRNCGLAPMPDLFGVSRAARRFGVSQWVCEARSFARFRLFRRSGGLAATASDSGSSRSGRLGAKTPRDTRAQTPQADSSHKRHGRLEPHSQQQTRATAPATNTGRPAADSAPVERQDRAVTAAGARHTQHQTHTLPQTAGSGSSRSSRLNGPTAAAGSPPAAGASSPAVRAASSRSTAAPSSRPSRSDRLRLQPGGGLEP